MAISSLSRCLALTAAFCAVPQLALAQEAAAISSAREVAKQGLSAFDAGDYPAAADKLFRAYAVVKVPTLALYTARALVKVGKLVEAAEVYLEASRLEIPRTDRETHAQAQQAAAKEREQLLPRLSRLKFELRGAAPREVEIEVDGAKVPSSLFDLGHLVNPGALTVVATRGGERQTRQLKLGEGEQKVVVFELTSPAAMTPEGTPPPSRSVARASAAEERRGGAQRTAGYIALAVGGAGLVAGATTGGLALSRKGKLDDGGCDGHSCYADQSGDVDGYNALRTFSTVGFVVVGVGAVTGLTLLLTAPKPGSKHGSVGAWVRIGSAGIRGTF